MPISDHEMRGETLLGDGAKAKRPENVTAALLDRALRLLHDRDSWSSGWTCGNPHAAECLDPEKGNPCWDHRYHAFLADVEKG